MILRCTKKLLAVLGAGRVAEPGPTPDAEDWYASLLWFDRRKCLLLTHAATLFSIFEADVHAVDLRATTVWSPSWSSGNSAARACRLQRSATCAPRS
ncbi:MAG: DUF6933 domain-containing protein [Micromonosporaceae bacterium]